MDWKAIAINDLKKYNDLLVGRQILKERIEALEKDSVELRSALGYTDSVSGANTNNQDKILNNIVMREKLVENLAAITVLITRIETGLSVLTSDEHLAIRVKYIDNRKHAIDEISSHIGYEKRHAYRVLNSALLRFTRATYGITDL